MIIVVTGSSKGIGNKISNYLSKKNQVIGLSRSKNKNKNKNIK